MGATVLAAAEGLTVTAAMFDGLVTAVSSNAATLLPVGASIMAIMIGVSLVPRIIYKFL